MDEIWFEDELVPSVHDLEEISKEMSGSIKRGQFVTDELIREVRGAVRAQKPDWGPLTSEEAKNVLISGRRARLFKARLIFEFEIPEGNYERGARFVSASCEAQIRTCGGHAEPEVYDMFPKDLYEGEPQKISLKFGPAISIDKVDASVGEIGTDLAIGQVAPVIIGYFGTNKQQPHWELRPQNKSLLGRQYMWMVLIVPEGCIGLRLAARVEAVIQTKFGPFAIGPKEKVWENRPSIVIC